MKSSASNQDDCCTIALKRAMVLLEQSNNLIEQSNALVNQMSSLSLSLKYLLKESDLIIYNTKLRSDTNHAG